LVPAGGIGIFRAIENTQVIDFPTRQKRTIPRNHAQLERIWNADRGGKQSNATPDYFETAIAF
jgi:hypothetical protein